MMTDSECLQVGSTYTAPQYVYDICSLNIGNFLYFQLTNTCIHQCFHSSLQ